MSTGPKLDSELVFPGTETAYIQARPSDLASLLDDFGQNQLVGAGASFCGGLTLSTLLTDGVPSDSTRLLIFGIVATLAIVFAGLWWRGLGSLAVKRTSFFEQSGQVVLTTKGFTVAVSGEWNDPEANRTGTKDVTDNP